MKKILFLIVLSSLKFNAQNDNAIDSLINIGQYDNAISLLKKSDKKENFFKIAKVYEELGDYNNAILNYELYRTRDTLNTQVNFQYGLALLHENNPKAISIFKTLSFTQNSEVFYYYLGLAYEKQKNNSEAINSWLNSYKLNPYYFKNIYKLSLTLANQNKLSLADSIASNYLKKYENNSDILKIRGQVYYYKKEYDLCALDFEKVRINKNEDENVLEKLANSYLVLKEYEKAIEIYSELIIGYQIVNNPNLYYNRGKCYGFIGKIEEAEKDINQSIKMREYTFDNEYFYLGYFYQQEEKYDKALQNYQKVLQINPDYSEAVFQIIAIKDHLGQSPTILIKEYENYLEKFDNISYQRRFLINKRIEKLKGE